jgi:serralysin
LGLDRFHCVAAEHDKRGRDESGGVTVIQEPSERRNAVANDSKWCFAWPAQRPGQSGRDRAALVRGAQWTSGDRITVSFLDGDPEIQARVAEVAEQWTAPGMANLTLDFRRDTDTLIRISFQYEGSWSVIGTTCRQVTDQRQPTMNYGWLTPSSTDDELERVVLHEFGHALGLIHEHQNPAGGINWDRAAVMRDLSRPPNNWSPDVIELNMFQPYSAQETNFSQLDPDSIMMYPLPATWTTDGFSIGLNSGLSEQDRAFIREQYS